MIFSIKLTDADLEFIGSLLDEAPFRKVLDLSRRIQAQVNEQQAPPLEPPLLPMARKRKSKG